jgi:NAD(P)-dependent dehydrogenase (short-subunit alcohol dehydrogenase family)
MFSLKNKNVIVTGGGSGIGRAISLLFASQGASVTIVDLSLEAADEVCCEITDAGFHATVVACDVSQQTQVLEVFQTMHPIDILVNNAGIAHVGNLHETSEADLDRLYNVNVKGCYNCLFAALPGMMERKKGVILNMASIAALVGLPDRFAYSVTKGAVHAMTLSVARDYLPYNIRCNSISPARVHTPFVDGFLAKNYPGQEAEMFARLATTQPIGRMGTPEEIAALALYLCSDEAGFITLGSNSPT